MPVTSSSISVAAALVADLQDHRLVAGFVDRSEDRQLVEFTAVDHDLLNTEVDLDSGRRRRPCGSSRVTAASQWPQLMPGRR